MSRRDAGDLVQGLNVIPDGCTGNKEITMLISDSWYGDYLNDGCKSAALAELIKEKRHIRIIELAGTGSLKWQLKYDLRDNGNNGAAFDQSTFSMRVEDIITSYTVLKETGFENIRIIAEKGAIPAALAACAILNVPLTADCSQLDENVWNDPINHQPLIGRIGGLAGLKQLQTHCS